MQSLLSLIGQNLAKFRKQKGLTQESLAKEAGVSRATVARYESGEGGIDAKTIAIFAQALNIEEIDLVAIPKPPVTNEFEARLRALEIIASGKVDIPPLPYDLADTISKLSPQTKEWLFDLIRGAILLDNESKHSILYQVRVLTSDVPAREKKTKDKSS